MARFLYTSTASNENVVFSGTSWIRPLSDARNFFAYKIFGIWISLAGVRGTGVPRPLAKGRVGSNSLLPRFRDARPSGSRRPAIDFRSMRDRYAIGPGLAPAQLLPAIELALVF